MPTHGAFIEQAARPSQNGSMSISAIVFLMASETTCPAAKIGCRSPVAEEDALTCRGTPTFEAGRQHAGRTERVRE